MTIKTKDVERLMKQCQIGVGGKDALNKAHNIMADCYGTLGALARERDQLQAELAKYRDAPVVAWSGGKHGCEWTTDKAVADKWLSTASQQAVPLIIKPGENK